MPGILRNPNNLAHTRYVAYLVTATLCLAAAPRQQVLRQWQLGSSFMKKDDGRYWCLMLSNMNKNGKATTFAIADELTIVYDQYLSVVRPKLVGNKVQHSFVFCKQTGDPVGETFDFSDWTRSVCKELIGRPINCHAFRAALVTSFYQAGATQSQMNALADVMAHDSATARNYYYKVDAQKQALEVGNQMQQAYIKLDAAASAAAAAQPAPASEVNGQPGATPFSPAEVAAAGAVATAAGAIACSVSEASSTASSSNRSVSRQDQQVETSLDGATEVLIDPASTNHAAAQPAAMEV